MKKIIIISVSLLIVFFQYKILFAEREKFGIGFILGDPSGLTGKIIIDEISAIDLGIGDSLGEGYYLYGDLLIHSNEIIPAERFLTYIGIGIGFHHFEKERRIKDDIEENRIGVRVPFGVEYLTPNVPFGIFIELVPELRISPEVDFGFRAGLGARFYF